MVLDAKTNQFKKQTNKPSGYDELEKKGEAYTVYKESENGKIGFVVNSAGQVTANGAQLNSANILKATLTNCKIQSADVGVLIGGSITGATINGSTISGGTITGGSISGASIKTNDFTATKGTISGCTIKDCNVTSLTINGTSVSLLSETFAYNLKVPFQEMDGRVTVTPHYENKTLTYGYYSYSQNADKVITGTWHTGSDTITVLSSVDVAVKYYRPNRVKTKTIQYFGTQATTGEAGI